ncbi:conjugative transposon protein TraM [Myroides pelagicus]|uniref:Conjugative transposon protein TraM n=1 Tax=Myroides pelagicus TaxID=270914 RepID=A0A7K1GNZ2_9FLAO|nr:conjugative transposon protein TraM [Myroides pelagicus]MTH30498.1 conjugative transposon protein TraM [Myroides pelagicus]
MIQNHQNTQSKKKLLVSFLAFSLMGGVFLLAIYFIFKPTKSNIDIDETDLLPAAMPEKMPSNKIKAYEFDLWSQTQKKNSNHRIYFKDFKDTITANIQRPDQNIVNYQKNNNLGDFNHFNTSYDDSQRVIQDFYSSKDDDHQTLELKQKIEKLELELSQKSIPEPLSLQGQLDLMEKSYQMAAKYLPDSKQKPILLSNPIEQEQKKRPLRVQSQKDKSVVSTLVSVLKPIDLVSAREENSFYSIGVKSKEKGFKNTIKVTIAKDQVIVDKGYVELKLCQGISIGDMVLEKGSLIMGLATVSDRDRVIVNVHSILIKEYITPVELLGYDIYGQIGVQATDFQEVSATKQVLSSLATTSNRGITLSRGASDQIKADLAKGVISGVSDYFSKKVKSHRVTLRKGQQLFLVSKD